MYAVIKTGGKQYKVASNDVIKIEKIAGVAGNEVIFNEVLKPSARPLTWRRWQRRSRPYWGQCLQ